jgi:glutathione synthase/RimK-type ligase-like ATP-grasp enzyme
MEARKSGLELKICEAREVAYSPHQFAPSDFDLLYIRNPYFRGSPEFLPSIIELAERFTAQGRPVVDANLAQGNLGKGKMFDYERLVKAGVSVPQTQWFSAVKNIRLPVVVRWNFGLKAKGVFKVETQAELQVVQNRFLPKDLLLQELIVADFEYKVVTVGYKTLPKLLKFAIKPGGFGLDFSQVQILEASEKMPAVLLAEQAAKILGRELAKADILEKDGQLYLLEVNRYPGLKNFEQVTGYNAFRDFLAYLQKKSKMV